MLYFFAVAIKVFIRIKERKINGYDGMADMFDLGSSGSNTLRVQVLLAVN